MGGIKAYILGKDGGEFVRKFRGSRSHFHIGDGSYLNVGHASKNLPPPEIYDPKTTYPDPAARIDPDKQTSILVFPEGIAKPYGVYGAENLWETWWTTWFLPTERSLQGRPHSGGGWGWLGKVFGWPYIVIWVIVLGIVGYFAMPFITKMIHSMGNPVENTKITRTILENGKYILENNKIIYIGG
jgi:hypothetical protein